MEQREAVGYVSSMLTSFVFPEEPQKAELDPEDFQNRAKVVYRMFLFDEIP